MRLFKVKNNKPECKKSSRFASRSIKRAIILNNQSQLGFEIKTDYTIMLKKCKQDLEILKEQIIDFARELET